MVYLFGNLNIPEACWNDTCVKGYTRYKNAKEDIIEALINGGDRKQIVTCPTRQDNILDIIIIPTSSNCCITISPEPTESRAGTDHEWLLCKITDIPYESNLDEDEVNKENKIPKIDYKIVREIIKQHQWTNHPDDCKEWDEESYVHNENTCVACEFNNLCKRAIKEGTTYKFRRKPQTKKELINEAIKEQSELTMALQRKKIAAPSQYNIDKWKHQSKILNEMCDIRAKQMADKFVSNLDKDKNVIYKPIKDQNGGQIRFLDDENGVRITDPKGVGNILAEHLSNRVFKKSDVPKTKSKVKAKIKNQNSKREKGKIKLFKIDVKLVEDAMKEITVNPRLEVDL